MGKTTNNLTRMTLVAVAVAAISVPAAVSAGGYGTAGVKDDNVSNYAAEGSRVWCGRLDRNVPQALAAQMNCQGTPTASRERRGVLGFLSGLRNNPDAKTRVIDDVDDDDDRIVTRAPRPTPTPTEETPPTTTSTVGKWDRLADFNVTQENYPNQSQAFKDAVSAYRETHGFGGDWSGFKPN
jgi:hypothetical protein